MADEASERGRGFRHHAQRGCGTPCITGFGFSRGRIRIPPPTPATSCFFYAYFFPRTSSHSHAQPAGTKQASGAPHKLYTQPNHTQEATPSIEQRRLGRLVAGVGLRIPFPSGEELQRA